MKLYITDRGDPSVGIFPIGWSVDCPFDEKTEPETLEFFREQIKGIYREFAEGRIVAEYDFELKLPDLPSGELDIEFDKEYYDEQQERDDEQKLTHCRCGAYQLNKNGNLIKVADCCC